MIQPATFDPKKDFFIERWIDAQPALVWKALTLPEHLCQWYMPKAWGRVVSAELDLQPGGIIRLDIAVGDGPAFENQGCVLDVVLERRLVWTSMLFAGYRPAVFDDIPITALMTMEPEKSGTRYRFTALHRSESELQDNMASGFYQGTEIAVDQFVELVLALKSLPPISR